jgi:thiosulfate dehydrogenase (quinone) large subunit
MASQTYRSVTRTPDAHTSAVVSTPAAQIPASPALRYVTGAIRLSIGWIFLWAFLDKLFGLGHETKSAQAWIHGGSPTYGFLKKGAAGPFADFYHGIAGQPWADWLFMLGLLGIGLALVAGVGLRIAAVAGTAMMALMWVAEWPPARHLSGGAPSMSTNPFADYHLVYAVVLIALAAVGAGATWGLGRAWARLAIVSRNRWLL